MVIRIKSPEGRVLSPCHSLNRPGTEEKSFSPLCLCAFAPLPLALLFFLCILTFLLPCAIGCHSKNPTVAKLGDQEITTKELEAALARLPEHRREEFKEKVLNELLEVKFFSQEARKAGLENDPQIKESLEKITNENLARFFVKKHLDKQAEPSEEDLKLYYLKNKDKFHMPKSVSVQHIVVQGMKRAGDLLKELKEGASFEELAKRKSICRCWKKGGTHGWLFKGRMDPGLEKAAFDLENEKLGDSIIETKDGYQIIKVLDKRDEMDVPFEKAKAGIRSMLFWERKNRLLQKYYEEAKVNFHPSEEHLLAKVGEEGINEEVIAPIMKMAKEKEKDRVRDKWVHYLVETDIFSREARKVNLENDPEVAAEIRSMANQTLANAFRKKFIIDKVKVSDQEIDKFYQSHLEEFRIPAKVRVESIVVKTQEEAEALLKELKEGTPFRDLAMKKSIHPSAARGGDVGWFAKGEKDSALEKAAFALEKGAMSGVIKTEAGCEVIKLMDKKGGEIMPLDEVKQTIKMKLMMQHLEEAKQRYYKKGNSLMPKIQG